MDQPSTVAPVLASMHPDGHVRERAVTRLAASECLVADRGLAARLTDHVPVIREAASRALLSRTTLESAARIMPVLELIRERARAGEVRELYLRKLFDNYGERRVWTAFRASDDRALRRAAFRHTLSHGLLDVDAAITELPHETDQIVRSLLSRAIAERAAPAAAAGVLLSAGTAEGRALGLVRLRAAQIDPDVLKELLVDSSVLVRLWARTRWTELGHEPLPTYASMTRDNDLRPRLRARAYTGLLEAGGSIGHNEALELLASGEHPLARVGLKHLVDNAEPEDTTKLFNVLTTGTNKEAKLASAALIRLRRAWTVADLRQIRSSEDPELRRRGWRLQRGRGGWEETLADLELLDDNDEELSRRGRSATPPMYEKPDEEQRQRLRTLVARVDLPPERLLDIAAAAGIRDALPSPRAVTTDPQPVSPRGWQVARLWRRGK